MFACVRSDAITGGELNTLYRIFSNSSDNPEKIFVLGTQWDNLNDPEEDWKLQKNEWIKYLSTENCYGSKEVAQRNIIHVAAYIMNLCRDYNPSDNKSAIALSTAIFKLEHINPFGLNQSDIEEHLETLMEKSNVETVKRRIEQDIVPKYKKYLMQDITSNYEAVNREIHTFFEETKACNEDVLKTSLKSADEIRASYEKSKKELEDVQAYREQLVVAMNSVKVNTDARVEELCKSLEEMTKKA